MVVECLPGMWKTLGLSPSIARSKGARASLRLGMDLRKKGGGKEGRKGERKERERKERGKERMERKRKGNRKFSQVGHSRRRKGIETRLVSVNGDFPFM